MVVLEAVLILTATLSRIMGCRRLKGLWNALPVVPDNVSIVENRGIPTR
jgi:hypothetical protein